MWITYYRLDLLRSGQDGLYLSIVVGMASSIKDPITQIWWIRGLKIDLSQFEEKTQLERDTQHSILKWSGALLAFSRIILLRQVVIAFLCANQSSHTGELKLVRVWVQD